MAVTQCPCQTVTWRKGSRVLGAPLLGAPAPPGDPHPSKKGTVCILPEPILSCLLGAAPPTTVPPLPRAHQCCSAAEVLPRIHLLSSFTQALSPAEAGEFSCPASPEAALMCSYTALLYFCSILLSGENHVGAFLVSYKLDGDGLQLPVPSPIFLR